MWQIIAGQAGMGMLNAYRSSKAQRAMDKYNNAIVGIQAAQSQNTITENVAENRAQHAQNKVDIQASRLMAAAKVKAGAAAAGVAGGAVEATLFDIGRSAGRKLATETDRFDVSLQITDNQRRNVAFQRKMATKQLTNKPDFLTAAMTGGLNIMASQMNQSGSSGTQLEAPKRTMADAGSGGEQPGFWSRMKDKFMT